MKNKQLSPLEQAKNYAFLLLKFRLRSEKEIACRLKKKKFPAEIIAATVSFLKDKSFLDDQAFAKAWIDSRLKRPLGLRRLEQELKTKGVDKEIIRNRIQEIKKDYSEEETVAELARARLKKLRGIEPQKAKQRIFGYLMRRGFSPDIVMDAVRQL